MKERDRCHHGRRAAPPRTRGSRALGGAWPRFQRHDFPEPSARLSPFVRRYWIVEWDYDEPYRQLIVRYPHVRPTFRDGGAPQVHGVSSGHVVRSSRVRRLQRLFAAHVGVGPKWVIRRYRLHEATERMARGDAIVWADLAGELGYADQAHFSRDFAALFGEPPTRYARRY